MISVMRKAGFPRRTAKRCGHGGPIARTRRALAPSGRSLAAGRGRWARSCVPSASPGRGWRSACQSRLPNAAAARSAPPHRYGHRHPIPLPRLLRQACHLHPRLAAPPPHTPEPNPAEGARPSLRGACLPSRPSATAGFVAGARRYAWRGIHRPPLVPCRLARAADGPGGHQIRQSSARSLRSLGGRRSSPGRRGGPGRDPPEPPRAQVAPALEGFGGPRFTGTAGGSSTKAASGWCRPILLGFEDALAHPHEAPTPCRSSRHRRSRRCAWEHASPARRGGRCAAALRQVARRRQVLRADRELDEVQIAPLLRARGRDGMCCGSPGRIDIGRLRRAGERWKRDGLSADRVTEDPTQEMALDAACASGPAVGSPSGRAPTPDGCIA